MIQNVPRPGGFLSLFRRAFAVPLFGFVLLAGASPGFAQDPVTPALAAEAESLIQALVALNARYQLAAPAERSELLDELERVGAERQQLLASFIQDHSDEVLRLALPQGLRPSLPDRVQAYLEEQQTVEGELEVLHVDHKDPRKSHYGYFLTTPSGKRFSLHFVANPPGLLSGAKVRVHGVFLKRAGPADLTAGAMAVPDGVTNVETLAAGGTSGSTTTSALTTVLPSTFGAQKTLVILVNFQDKATQPYTPDTARNIVFNTTSNFDLENSFQQVWLTGDVYGWYTIPLDSTVCDAGQIASHAKQAATAAGVNLSAYTRYLYAFPDNACDWWGLGTVGGNPSQAWINGSLAKGVGHEMGHNLGLYHSRGLECGTTTLGSNCTTIEYGDTLDKMGGTAAGHFNAFQKERLGWLNSASSPPILTVQADGIYWLEPYETGPGVDPKALKILKSVDPTMGTKTWYYVEYRQAVGFDSFLSSNGNVLNGVVVHTGTENSGNSSDLLDMTPATSSWNDPALEIGQSFYDPDAGVTIAPTWANGSNAQVSVSIGPLGCAPTNPALALSPSQSQWVQAGATVIYTVTLTNKENARCSESSFNLHAGVPSGWTAAFASTMLTLDPGASASTTLTVTSSASAADGFYTIPVGATNGADMSYTASASATVVIAASLNVVASTNQPSYTPNQSVTPTAQVHGNGSPVPNTAASTSAVTVAVTISPGSIIQAAINANPAGTVFTLPAGIWHRQQFYPKAGNQFIGDPAGGTILTGDDVTSSIYGSDGSVNLGVLFKDIIVEHYGIDSPACIQGAIHGASGWVFENATFRLNNCAGLNIGRDSRVTGGKYNDNKHAGIQGYQNDRVVIESAEIARNNTRHDDPEWDAAGLKFADADAVVLRNNYVHDNYGPGLWCDINCSNNLIEGNTVIANYSHGIFYEISPGITIIRNNVSNDNGATLVGRAQIIVSSSNGVEVYGNNVRASGIGATIVMQADNRPDALVTANNSFHHNVVTMAGSSNRTVFPNFGGPVGSGNSSNFNSFNVLNLTHFHFFWNTSSAASWTAYRSASGQDANSTLQVRSASVAGNTLGCPALTGCAGTSDTTPPTVSLTAPTNGSTVSGSSVPVSASASDNVGVASVDFKVDGTTLSRDTTSPYAVSWNTTGATNASHTLTAVARDAAGNTTTSSGVKVTVSNTAPGTQTPYDGTAVLIPGTIQAEDYDNGGEGVAYHDSDSANKGGLYRPNESVDIKATSDTGGGYAIGWIVQPNEWFEYTVNVASSGTFTFAARVATIYPGKRFHVEIDGVNVTGSLGVPVTGSAWDTTWGTVTRSGINLTAGLHIMRVVADTDLFDLNYFTWTAQPTNTAVNVPVALSSGDAEEQQSTGRMYLNSADLELTEDPSQWGSTGRRQMVGLRFANIAIPKGATITNAYIQFTSKETWTTPTSLTIRAQASNNSAVFTTTAFNVSSRPLTSATVSWSPVVWSVVGEAGTKQRTPNLASVIQEVVNRSGWIIGNSIAVIVKGSGRRTAWAYDGSTSRAPLLHIEYSVQ